MSRSNLPVTCQLQYGRSSLIRDAARLNLVDKRLRVFGSGQAFPEPPQSKAIMDALPQNTAKSVLTLQYYHIPHALLMQLDCRR